MIKTKQVAVYALSLALVIALLPTSTYAQSVNKNTLTEARCIMAKDKIATHLTAFTTHQTERTNAYKAITNRVNTFITTSTEAEYTLTAQLTTARDSYERAVSIYTTQATVYQKALEKTQTIACGVDNTEFKKELTNAQTQLTTLRSNSLSVKTAVKQNVVPALMNYADWLKTSNTDAKENK